MKHLYIIGFFLFCLISQAKANLKSIIDTGQRDSSKKIFTAIEQSAEYPGGVKRFYKYIEKELKYPDVARLIGIDGKVIVSFIVEKDGHISTVTPVSCIGAGCDAAAVDVIAGSVPWVPGMQNGKPVRVQYTVPINFSIKKPGDMVWMKDLRKADYGFIFQMKGHIYTLDQAETMLGKKFPADLISEALPFENGTQFQVPNKKALYLIIMK
jgi:TonB family protein